MTTISPLTLPEISEKNLRIITQLRPHLNSPEKIQTALSTLEEKGYVFFIAEKNGEISGFISALKTYNLYLGNFTLVDDLIVDEAMRGENIGSQLLERVEQYAKEKNISTIKLDSGIQRSQAHHFYEKHQFQKKCYTFEKNL